MYGPHASDTWKPWQYDHQISVVKKVEKFKKSLEGSKISATTKRNKVTAFIASKKSRQEFEPVIGELIDRAHVDPLHLKNNACALGHRNILHIALSMSKLSNSVASFARFLLHRCFLSMLRH